VSASPTDRPLVSVVIETVTARYDLKPGASMVEDLTPTLRGLQRQTYPAELIEAIVVLDPNVPDVEAEAVSRRFGFVRFAHSTVTNYYAAKNAGAQAARGAVVALLDGDCQPDVEWVERLVASLGPGVAAVGGRTRYASSGTPLANTLAVPDFGYVVGDDSGAASGFNINNVAFRREVLLEHPLDARLRRNGGCYLLYHQLRAAGERVDYEPRAIVVHGVGDIRGTEFLRKHFARGFDGVSVYRLDDEGALRGSALLRRFGPAALVPITARRIALDWVRLARKRRQIGITAVSLPYFAMVAVALRLVEFGGMVAAVLTPRRYAGAEPGVPRTPSRA
jgi:glycosyltransferase involved in cell wall biosynthesis